MRCTHTLALSAVRCVVCLHLQQVKILRRIGKHPSIVELLDVFEERNSIQLVFELMPRGELFEYLVKEGPFKEVRCRKRNGVSVCAVCEIECRA